MIAIKFSPIYEDRVSIYLRSSNLSNLKQDFIRWYFKDTPIDLDQRLCYWTLEYSHSKYVNKIINELVEMKKVMGIDDL